MLVNVTLYGDDSCVDRPHIVLQENHRDQGYMDEWMSDVSFETTLSVLCMFALLLHNDG